MQQAAEQTGQWQYQVKVLKNPEVHPGTVGSFQDELNRLGADGWELVSTVTTVKSWLNLTGNDLVFLFKRPGVGPFKTRPDDDPAYVPWA